MSTCAVSHALSAIQLSLSDYPSFEPYRFPGTKRFWLMATSLKIDIGAAFDEVTVKSWHDEPALRPDETRLIVERLLVALGIPHRKGDREPHGYFYLPEPDENLSAHDKVEIIAAVRSTLAEVVRDIPGLADRCPDLTKTMACSS